MKPSDISRSILIAAAAFLVAGAAPAPRPAPHRAPHTTPDTAQAPTSAIKRASVLDHSPLTVKDATFHSAALARDMRYRIYLPAANADSSRHFPVLYLLHGVDGNFTDWDKQSRLRQYAENRDLIIVMPDGGNSWYVNSATNPKNRFEDYIVADLIAEVDQRYRTIPRRESRAIAGLSMGGYGALNLALRHPELFAFAGSMSGALNAPTDLGPRQPAFQKDLLRAFGPPGSAARAQNDVFELLKHADVARLPNIYVSCGLSDVFLELNRRFADQLEAQNVPHEAHTAPGGHDWKFWDETIKEILPIVMRKLSQQQK